MNSTKRVLELVAAIFSIVLGAILALGSLLIIVEGLAALGSPGVAAVLLLTFLLFATSVASIVIGALVCGKKIKNGVPVQKRGLVLALVIINGIIAFLELLGGGYVYFVFFAVPCVLGIISLCLKDNHKENEPTPVSNGIDDQINF